VSDIASKETCSPPTSSTCQVTIYNSSLLSYACQGTWSPLRSAAGNKCSAGPVLLGPQPLGATSLTIPEDALRESIQVLEEVLEEVLGGS